jgi:hypothetical protein
VSLTEIVAAGGGGMKPLIEFIRPKTIDFATADKSYRAIAALVLEVDASLDPTVQPGRRPTSWQSGILNPEFAFRIEGWLAEKGTSRPV